ncbi:MAG: hypothetical protein ACYCSQ_02615 [bacterium]
MINTKKLQKILSKKKDKIETLTEILRLSVRLAGTDEDKIDEIINIAIVKVENLLFLQKQSKRSTGYILKESDYKALGTFERHLKKLRRRYKQGQKTEQLKRIMPKLVELKKSLNWTELLGFARKKYKINCSRTLFLKIFKKINNLPT